MLILIAFPNDYKDLVLLHPAAADRDEVIPASAEHLAGLGYMLPAFVQALVDRENHYPTGIPMEEINVAIPHAQGSYVKQSAILACILREDGMFGSLADKDERIPVRPADPAAPPSAEYPGRLPFGDGPDICQSCGRSALKGHAVKRQLAGAIKQGTTG